MSNLIENQAEVAGNIIGLKSKKPVTPGYVSALLQGRSKINAHILESILSAYPFTNPNFFIKSDHLIDFKKLIKYLVKKHDTTQKDIAKKIGVNASTISKLSQDQYREWQEIFDFFNNTYDYKLNAKYIMEQSFQMGYIVPVNTEYNSIHCERTYKFINYLFETGQVSSINEFAEKIKVNKVMIYNLKNKNQMQDLTKSMIVSMATEWPELSLDWLVLGRGEMIR